MDCNNNGIDQLSSASGHVKIQGHENFGELRQMEMEIKRITSKLLDCHIECECTDEEMCNINHLTDKGKFVLKNIERRYSDLNEELKQVHLTYKKCFKKAMDSIIVPQKLKSMAAEREKIKNEFKELKKVCDKNTNTLMGIKMMITMQEKRNIALIKKLQKIACPELMTPELQARVNRILNYPSITNVKNTT